MGELTIANVLRDLPEWTEVIKELPMMFITLFIFIGGYFLGRSSLAKLIDYLEKRNN